MPPTRMWSWRSRPSWPAGTTFISRCAASQPGQSWRFATGEHELALVVLSGSIAVESNLGHWPRIGERKDVFAGPPAALFLPRRTTFGVTATTACEFAVAWARDRPRRRAQADPPGRCHGRDPRRRQRHPPDQQHHPARLRLPPPGAGRGLHPRRQLVELPAAQARHPQGRCGRQPARGRPGGDLLLQARPAGGLRLPAHLHRSRVAAAPRRPADRRRGAGARTTTPCSSPRATIRSPARPATPPTT